MAKKKQITKRDLKVLVGKEYADLVDNQIVAFANQTRQERVVWADAWNKNIEGMPLKIMTNKRISEKRFDALLQLGGLQ